MKLYKKTIVIWSLRKRDAEDASLAATCAIRDTATAIGYGLGHAKQVDPDKDPDHASCVDEFFGRRRKPTE